MSFVYSYVNINSLVKEKNIHKYVDRQEKHPMIVCLFMEPLELFHHYFRVALKAKLQDLGWGSQGRLADETGIGRNPLNGYLQGIRNFSEDRKQIVAKHLGTTYEEMIAQGRQILIQAGEPADLYPIVKPANEEVVLFGETIAHPSFPKACHDLKTIFESDNASVIAAVCSSLTELSTSAISSIELKQLKAETEDLKKRLEQLEQLEKNELDLEDFDFANASGAE